MNKFFDATPISSVHTEISVGHFDRTQVGEDGVEKMLLTTSNAGEPVVLIQHDNGGIAVLNLSRTLYWEFTPCDPDGGTVSAEFRTVRYDVGVSLTTPDPDEFQKAKEQIERTPISDFKIDIGGKVPQFRGGELGLKPNSQDHGPKRGRFVDTYLGNEIVVVAPGSSIGDIPMWSNLCVVKNGKAYMTQKRLDRVHEERRRNSSS